MSKQSAVRGKMRFGFGKNWKRFSQRLSDQRLQRAKDSIKDLLATENLVGCEFLDAGCGSGLSSLAALELQAAKVVSFDYDIDSVECTVSLREKYAAKPNWIVSQASVLDRRWLASQGQFDVVYSWGVLHHTGYMWEAIDVICSSVKHKGILCISIYNDQGFISRLWTFVKRFYNMSPRWVQFLLIMGYLAPASLWFVLRGLFAGKSPRNWFPVVNERGMHFYYDVVDWLGGYPFETATPEQITRYVEQRGFATVKVVCRSGSGCNEFVFRRMS